MQLVQSLFLFTAKYNVVLVAQHILGCGVYVCVCVWGGG